MAIAPQDSWTRLWVSMVVPLRMCPGYQKNADVFYHPPLGWHKTFVSFGRFCVKLPKGFRSWWIESPSHHLQIRLLLGTKSLPPGFENFSRYARYVCVCVCETFRKLASERLGVSSYQHKSWKTTPMCPENMDFPSEIELFSITDFRVPRREKKKKQLWPRGDGLTNTMSTGHSGCS